MRNSKSKKAKSATVADLNIIEKPSVPIGPLGGGETIESAKRLALRLIDPEIRDQVSELPLIGDNGWNELAFTYAVWSEHLMYGELPKWKSQNVISEWQLLNMFERHDLGHTYDR